MAQVDHYHCGCAKCNASFDIEVITDEGRDPRPLPERCPACGEPFEFVDAADDDES